MEISVPKAGGVRIRNDGFHIILEGATVIPWNAALEVAREMIAQARRIEAKANADKIIADQAVLVRLGIPLGLTNNKDIAHEAWKAAQYDRDLRRFITGARVKGIPSGEILGTPGLIMHPPKPKIESKEVNDNGKS